MRTLIAILLLFGVAACNPNQAVQEKNVEIIKKYIDGVVAKDSKVMEDLLADNYLGIGPSISDSTNKEQAIASWNYNSDSLYQSINYSKFRIFPITIADGDNKGDWVTCFAILDVTYVNGDAVTLLTNTSYKMENSKIAQTVTIYNEADAMEQLNYVFLDLDDLNQ